MNLIGLTGKMGSGKSTAVELLTQILKAPPIIVKFAAPLYEMQEMIYKRIENVYQRPADFTKDRKLLQWLGTNWGRETISPTLWVDLWKDGVKYNLENYPYYTNVCDDVRFDNEADTLKEMGGILIEIRSNKTQERINTTSGITGHASENGVDLSKVDYVIENNGTIEDLKNSLIDVLSKINNQTNQRN